MSTTPEDPRVPRAVGWHPETPRLRPFRLLISWIVSTAALLAAASIVPDVEIEGVPGAFAIAAIIAVLNAILPPIIAALRLPLTLLLGFVLVLLVDAVALKWASDVVDGSFGIDSFGLAMAVSLLAAAIDLILQVILGTNDDEQYTLRVVRRIARRQGSLAKDDSPGLICLEIDGLGLPVLERAMRSGHAPNLARWIAEDGYRLIEWETDLSSQTGASQAGILLGSNEGIPAFRWVEKDRGVIMSCSRPQDCAEIERRHATGNGLLVNGGASRGNLLSGEADDAILTISRLGDEVKANPGYRGFLANGFNVTRMVVLFAWEVVLELLAAGRQRRRDVVPRGHRGGVYPFLRAVMCVFVRDLVIYSVLTDMMRGRPAVYATFASYDEVAHHSGLERPDTLEALRKLDQQFGRVANARAYAPRPYEIVVLSDHGQTQGATFKQRNGYGLDELVERSLEGTDGMVSLMGGDEIDTVAGAALGEATGRPVDKEDRRTAAGVPVGDQHTVVMGSGNLGLIYLMEEARRLTFEELNERHPRLLPALREHEHIGWLLVRSSERGPLVLGPRGERELATGNVIGEDPLAPFSPRAAQHLLRTDGFEHVADIMVGSFYDPLLHEGCAFEELISFHGGLGGEQTEPFILAPPHLPLPDEELIGAAAVHEVLVSWRPSA
ncbi:phage holin family protein [Svornostia abyssi]|uniref:Phage holin family protein n=1 Tax=Svornostia abyssi TaxID=2898438 RepID=A0ABY5PI54_9ACTN|nr:phage holin family protein [Parviterribacteraceae bacterium J379]